MNQPNVLWICTDQQRFDTINWLGNREITTPNIDRLCQTGVAFANTYCQSPICTPSRASFLTGLYPSSVHNCLNGNDYWSGTAPLLTNLLSAANYETGLIGKLHLAGTAGRVEPGLHEAYDWIRWSSVPLDLWPTEHDYAQWVNSRGGSLSELTTPPQGDNYAWNTVPGVPTELHQTTWCAEKGEEFIRERANRGKPWLLSVNPFDPHPPFDPPPEFLAKYLDRELTPPLFRESDIANQTLLAGIDFQTTARRPSEVDVVQLKAAYYAMVELLDLMVGRLVGALEETGQRENTIVIFCSDHGETLGDHGLMLKGCRFYEGLVRVPLVVSWPGHFREGERSEELVELTDIAPTLLEVAGADTPRNVQGKSLLRQLNRHQQPIERHREFVRCEYYRSLNAAWRPHFEGSYGTMIRDSRYKLCVYHGHDIGELYDLQTDPHEFNNLWMSQEHRDTKLDLMKASFDRLAFAVDVGPEQTVRW